MKIYTSHFGNSRKLKEAGVKIICVAIGRQDLSVEYHKWLMWLQQGI